tara:strand:+ start:250 stop:450 length:201 start_codon:yes stop_codon:yes gene_type:complete
MKNSIEQMRQLEKAITGSSEYDLRKECKSDYTESECIAYMENRINNVSAKEAHSFIIEDREFVYDF